MSGATCGAHAALPIEQPQHVAWRRAALNGAFALFNTLRMLAYLPTAWAIHSSRDAHAHSLWTWAIWLGANLTMAAWLRDREGGRLNGGVLVSLGNATMCSLLLAVIVWHRL